MIIATMANPALTDTPGYAFKFNIGKIVQFTTEQQCTYTVGQERKLLCEIKFLVQETTRYQIDHGMHSFVTLSVSISPTTSSSATTSPWAKKS